MAVATVDHIGVDVDDQVVEGRLMFPVSIQTLLLALHALSQDRKVVSLRLRNGEFEEDEAEELNDHVDQVTRAIGELAELYEPQREGREGTYPTVEKIQALYD
ncbi:MAG: hypothetical protein ACTHL8_01955 [Burkholderiaceae bacterium]